MSVPAEIGLLSRDLPRVRPKEGPAFGIQDIACPKSRLSIELQTAATDKLIDESVCELYGLTEEEIRIVGGEKK